MATNERLRQALQTSGIHPDELADVLKVDQRTVRRWLAGGTPFARHRAQLVRALDTSEDQLWPQLATAAEPGAGVASHAIGEPLVAYPSADASDAPRIENLIAAAGHQIDLIVHTAGALPARGFDQLIAKADNGCRVRLLVAQPDRSLLPLLTTPGLEIRCGRQPHAASQRADDVALVRLAIAIEDSNQPPVLLEVSRDQAPGLFTRLTDCYQHAWELAEPIRAADHLAKGEEGRDVTEPGLAPPPPAAVVPRPSAKTRRWPGRPT